MRKIWIVNIVVSMSMLICGCGKVENPSRSQISETATPAPFVVHVSSSESAVPQETIEPEAVEIDWDAVLSLTAEHLPDWEALKDALPQPVTILESFTGDLGLDGKEDTVIVYEYPENIGEELKYRTLAVFTKDEGYECLAFHEKMILDSEAGGTFGDPYRYTRIEDNGELHINFYGGSAWRWGYDLWFELTGGELVMNRLVDSYSYSLSGDLVSLTHNFREQSTTCEATWYLEESNVAVLYEYHWPENISMPRFSDIRGEGDWGQYEVPEMDVPLQVFDIFYANEDNRSRFTDFSAEAILDKVKEENYPEMEKVMYDTDVIYLEEISAFVGYQMPGYYYENDEGLQLYYRTASYDADLGWEHEIGVSGDGMHDYILYRDIDKTSAGAQLDLLAKAEGLEGMWSYIEENNGGFAVTDLDRNGRLEIVFSTNMGTGRYSYNSFYEVNEEYDGVEECFYAEGTRYASEADILWHTEVECYYDVESNTRYYIFDDYLREGLHHAYVNRSAMYMEEGEVKSLPLAFKESSWNKEREDWDKICTSGDGEKLITEEDYDNAAVCYFEGMPCEIVRISWKKGFSDKSIVYEMLSESLAESSFVW